MSDVTVVSWSRYGKKRLYVKTVDGTEIGYVDLLTGAVVAAEGFEDAVTAVARDHSADDADAPASTPAVDLSANRAGAAARAKRDEINRQAPVRNLFARLLGVKTEERAWRIGGKGEEKVGKELERLPAGWHLLHAVQVSDAGTDSDHVVVGPGGVLTLNTKRHPNAKVTVYPHAIYVNGFKVDYLQKSRAEARRASALLTAACGFTVKAQGTIVFVDLCEFNEKGCPSDVLITTRRRVAEILQSLPKVLAADAVTSIYRAACSGTTWLPDR